MTFGQGDCGQLGLGDSMTERKKPFPVAGQLEGRGIVQVECGGMHTVVLTNDGKVSTEPSANSYCSLLDISIMYCTLNRCSRGVVMMRGR